MSEIAVSQHRKEYENALEQAPTLAWPEQIHYLEDGSTELRSTTQDYKLGNPESVVAPHRERIIETVRNNQATIIRSPTGTGKTTEITMYLAESGLFDRLYVTQPRVVAARSTTQYERSRLEPVVGADIARQMVGWHTAPDSDYDESTNVIINLTDGIPVQQLETERSIGKDELLIIDEVHEDKINMHLLMLLAKKYDIHVVVMSATVDVDEKAAYLADSEGMPAPIIDIEGRTYPIEERDYSIKENTNQPSRPNGSVTLKRDKVTQEHEEGEKGPFYRDAYAAVIDHARLARDIMLFVPDKRDVDRIMGKLQGRVPKSYAILGLHGDQTPAAQRAALRDYPGGKIIISTDVGMTSLTPNVDVVIDSGMSRLPRLDRGVDGLAVVPSSRAARDQRRGRCGRTKPGFYELVHLPGYPKPLSVDELETYDQPEILSKRPDEVILKLGRIGLDSCDQLIVPPSAAEVERAVHRLRRIGAVGLQGFALTHIGEMMDVLPLNAHAKRMLAESYQYSREVQLQMAAALAVEQAGGIHSRDITATQIRKLSKEQDADLLVGLDMFMEALKMTEDERFSRGVVEQKFQRAWAAYEGLATRHLDRDPDELRPPTDVERAQLHACLVSGVDQVYRAQGKGQYADGVQKMRRKARSSRLVTAPGDLVAGTPYNIGRVNNGMHSTARIVTNAFRVDIDSLREFAPDRIEDRPHSQYRVNKQGEVEEQISVHFDGRPLNKFYWQKAETSPKTREFLVNHLLEEELEDASNLPSSVQRLRAELAGLRHLQHRTDMPLDITAAVERMKAIIRENMPTEISTLHAIPSFTIDTHRMISDYTRQEILQDAPDVLTLFNELTNEFVDVPVTYIHNVAHITLSKELYPLLAADIPELHGRKVMVRPLNGHRYIDQAEAYAQRGARRDSRGTIVAPEEVRRRRQMRAMSDQQSATVLAQTDLATTNVGKRIKYRQSGRAHRGSVGESIERSTTL